MSWETTLLIRTSPLQALEKFFLDPTKNRFRLGGLVLEGRLVLFCIAFLLRSSFLEKLISAPKRNLFCLLTQLEFTYKFRSLVIYLKACSKVGGIEKFYGTFQPEDRIYQNGVIRSFCMIFMTRSFKSGILTHVSLCCFSVHHFKNSTEMEFVVTDLANEVWKPLGIFFCSSPPPSHFDDVLGFLFDPFTHS